MKLQKVIRIFLMLFLPMPVLLSSSAADIVIHIQHPWASEDSIRTTTPLYIISEESGWYPGKIMTDEGGNWYSYTFVKSKKTSIQRIQLMSVIPNPYDSMGSKLTYPATGDTLNMLYIFSSNPEANEVWISIPTPKSKPIIQFTPPASKVIAFYNPWEIGFPKANIEDLATVKMRRMPGFCGWFCYNYFASLDNILVKFVNTVNKKLYTQNGNAAGDFIDLTAALTTSDTVWIYPDPIPDGTPAVETIFPGITGDCGTVTLAVTLRDKGAGVDFGQERCDGRQKAITGMVQPRLGADGKPVKTAGACQSDEFPEWFVAEDLGKGYTNEVCHNITLQKNEMGLYEYDTDAFFPLDSFEFLDDAGTIPNPNYTLDASTDKKIHNFWFTMELGAKFEYVPGQTFLFRGDDDVWVYIDSQLVVDLGGLHEAVADSVDLDELNLTPGDTYSFKLFFAERKCCNSNFRIVTSINLRSTSNLFYEKDSSTNVTRYVMKEKRTKSNLACDSDGEIVDTVNADVVYYIEGPSFPVPYQLKPGKYFGDSTINLYGIVILATQDSSVLKLDTANFVGVLPGDYVINYYSTNDRSQGGSIPFTIYEVPKPPRIPNPVVNAAFFADNPYGQVNRAEIYFKNIPSLIPDSIQLFWPNNNKTRTIRNTGITADTVNKRHFTISLSVPFDKEVTTYLGNNNLGFSYSFDTTFWDPQETVPIRAADSVGPLLMSATLLQRVNKGQDTLLLTFSESVKDSSVLGQSLRLLKSSSKYLVNVTSIVVKADTVIAMVTTEGDVALSSGDSLQIVSSGPLNDLYGNHARIDNRPVVIRMRQSPANIEFAFYKDNNADGIVDEAQIEFDREVNIADVTTSFNWINDLSTGQLGSERIRSANESYIVFVNLEQAFNKAVNNITSEKMSVDVRYKQFPEIQVSHDVADSAAPVITSAIYAPAVSLQDGSSAPDTLYVKFSEEISIINTDTPLKFRKAGAYSDYIMHLQFLSEKASEYAFVVTSIEGSQYPTTSDSVWINPGSKLSDLQANIQSDSLNKRVLLQIRSTPLKFKFKVGPNPFNPTLHLVTITVDPSIRTREMVRIQAQVDIYDSFGNKLFSDLQKSESSTTPEIKIHWNGTNRSGRIVANGTYLALVRAEDLNLKSVETRNFFIGVKK